MIRAERVSGGIALRGDLAPNEVAYLDADWIEAAGPGPVPAAVVRAGVLHWVDGAALGPAEDADAAAGAAFAALAAEAAGAVPTLAAPIEVLGNGIVAEQIRRSLGLADGSGDDQPPAAIVDATGAPDALRDATRRLDDLGTLVLVGEPAGRAMSLNLYPDVHVRGLRLVGVGRPRLGTAQAVDEPPVPVGLDARLPPARWYRLSG
jgi:hypothetical protein